MQGGTRLRRARDEVVYHEPAEERGAYLACRARSSASLWGMKATGKHASLGKLVAFVSTTDTRRARAFYGTDLAILGLRLVSDDDFALVFDANGTVLRISKVETLAPAPFTVLGWEVADLAKTTARLRESGVTFERYAEMDQDEHGIWLAPGGGRVAWFKDPDDNLLSITEQAQ